MYANVFFYQSKAFSRRSFVKGFRRSRMKSSSRPFLNRFCTVYATALPLVEQAAVGSAGVRRWTRRRGARASHYPGGRPLCTASSIPCVASKLNSCEGKLRALLWRLSRLVAWGYCGTLVVHNEAFLMKFTNSSEMTPVARVAYHFCINYSCNKLFLEFFLWLLHYPSPKSLFVCCLFDFRVDSPNLIKTSPIGHLPYSNAANKSTSFIGILMHYPNLS